MFLSNSECYRSINITFLCDPPGSHICETVDPTLLLFSPLPSLFSFFPFFQRIFWRVRLLIKSKGKFEEGNMKLSLPFRRCGIDFPQRLKPRQHVRRRKMKYSVRKTFFTFPQKKERRKKKETNLHATTSPLFVKAGKTFFCLRKKWEKHVFSFFFSEIFPRGSFARKFVMKKKGGNVFPDAVGTNFFLAGKKNPPDFWQNTCQIN